nr:hypothetical protein CIT39_05350 [Bradyrhizobium symbiodeficiens]
MQRPKPTSPSWPSATSSSNKEMAMANTGMSNGKMKSACMHYNGAAGAKARAPQRDFNHPRTAAA